MENPSRRPALAQVTLIALGTLLLLPASRYIIRTHVQMELLTYSSKTDPEVERVAAASMADDYQVQLALAAEMPNSSTISPPGDPTKWSTVRNHHLEALTTRFPNSPSAYANLMRFMTMGDVRLSRNDDDVSDTAANTVTSVCLPEWLNMFDSAAQSGVRLDPYNAYFPMMRAIVLFNMHRDSEALNALKAAGRCARWTEYYQDENEGRIRLQNATYGEAGAIQHLNIAANLLFPQYAQLRAEARLARYLAGQAEASGNIEEGIEIRHALMRCGGLMRSQGTSYITSLVGIAIESIGMANPGGIKSIESSTSGHRSEAEASKQREKRRALYYAYLESNGHAQEAVWAAREISAADQAKSMGSLAVEHSIYNSWSLARLGTAWFANLVLLSSALIMVVLGASAHFASAVRPKRALLIWRTTYALLITGGVGAWEWQTARIWMAPFVDIQRMFLGFMGSSDTPDSSIALQSLAVGLSLIVPMVLMCIIIGLALRHRVSPATGLGRGLRGIAMPAAAVLFLIYSVSLLPTARMESVVKSDTARTVSSETQYFAEILHKTWPGDPQP